MEGYHATAQGFMFLIKLKEVWLKYGGGRLNTQYDDAANPALLKMLSESETNCFTEVRRVAQALGRNNERGFELFEKRPKRDPIKEILHQIESGYKGMILVETLCRLAYIADPFEISRLTVTRASEVGGVPVCYPYLFPKHGMRNVALGEDKAYWFFVQTLIAQTLPLVELHTTERQKQQISDLFQYSPRMTAEVCKAALAAAVRAYHHQWDTEWCGFRVEHAAAGVWADGNHPT